MASTHARGLNINHNNYESEVNMMKKGIVSRNHAVNLGIAGFLMLFGGMTIAQTAPSTLPEPNAIEKDVFQTEMGELAVLFIGHGTLMLECGGKVVHVDPWTRLADYSKLPKADLILITHEHQDHLDSRAITQIRQESTAIILSKSCADKIAGGQVWENGKSAEIAGLKIEAVPAYNIQNKRSDGSPYHPKGDHNGYIITFGKTRVYIAGDTENTPEMKDLKDIHIAFLPMNLPYTMTPEMAADAAKAFKPKILYPYHYGQTDLKQLQDLMKDVKDVEVRIRKMQ